MVARVSAQLIGYGTVPRNASTIVDLNSPALAKPVCRPLRVAQGRPLRRPPEEFLPEHRPLELAWITTERFIEEWRDRTRVANLCVNGHGLQGSVWVIHRGLRAAFPDVRFTPPAPQAAKPANPNEAAISFSTVRRELPSSNSVAASP